MDQQGRRKSSHLLLEVNMSGYEESKRVQMLLMYHRLTQLTRQRLQVIITACLTAAAFVSELRSAAEAELIHPS
jgi:hypothetical protein